MAVDDAFARFDLLVREHLDPAVENLEIDAENQDVLWSLMQSSRNVQKLGRTEAGTPGYQAKWRVRLQRGGLIEGRAFGDTSIEKMGPDNHLTMGTGIDALSVDPRKAPRRSYIPISSFLRKASGVYTLDQDSIEADLLSEPIEDVAAGAVEDVTVLLRGQASSLMWGAGNGIMGNILGTPTFTETTTVWTEISNAQIYRFVRGQRYVIATSNLSAPRVGTATDPAVVRCTGVDRQALKVAFQVEAGYGNIVCTSGDAIVMKGMYDFVAGASLACNGVESLLIKTGTFPDTSHNVANIPELQAFISGDPAALEDPTPEVVDEILDLMTAADPMRPPSLIAENSLWTLWSHLERRAHAVSIVPQGGIFTSSGGVQGPVVSNGGRPFIKLTSPKCRPNTIFGLDPATFIRFMPNDMNVRWRTTQGGAAGVGNIFRAITVGPQLTGTFAADFDTFYQIAQTRPNRNLIRKGLHNQRTYKAA
jgi:hypothetical protein